MNVNEGDCSIIEHISRHITVIDVCNASHPHTLTSAYENLIRTAAAKEAGINGNFNQKSYPDNPITYMQRRGISQVFRFVLTHPDLDHMDGIEALFETFAPINFWDTNNREEKDDWRTTGCSKYRESDWKFYKRLRTGAANNGAKRLTLYSGEKAKYFNVAADGSGGGDGLHILAPTLELVANANQCGDYNDCSYVILYKTSGHRILFAGDSHDATWEHVLSEHEADVKDIDILIAPHHGRDSDRDWEFLDVVKPALTLFGNASSKHLAYSAWNSRNLPFITNNQAGNIIINAGVQPMDVFVTCRAFAEYSNPYNAVFAEWANGYYWGEVKRAEATGAG